MASLNSLRTALWRVPPGASRDRPPVRLPFRIAGGVVALLGAVVVAGWVAEWITTGRISGMDPDTATLSVGLSAGLVVLFGSVALRGRALVSDAWLLAAFGLLAVLVRSWEALRHWLGWF